MVELQIPCHTVEAHTKVPVVSFVLQKVLSKYSNDRNGILLKTSIINSSIAKILLDHGYKQLSKFGHWCPVQVSPDNKYLKCFVAVIMCS